MAELNRSTHRVSRERIRRAAHLRCLYLLREAARLSPERVTDLLALDPETFCSAAEALPVRLCAAWSFLELKESGHSSIHNVDVLLGRLRAVLSGDRTGASPTVESRLGRGEITAVACSSDLSRLAGYSMAPLLASDANKVSLAVDTGRTLLEAVAPDLARHVLENVDLCAGLLGEHAEIRSFSNQHSPGLVFLVANNPAILIAEQLVHEATHVDVYIRSEDDAELADAFEAMPACYSPFTESIRPAERVFHGAASYGRVLSLWNSVARLPDIDLTWFDAQTSPAVLAHIERRISELTERIGTAWHSLLLAASAHEKVVLTQTYYEIVGTPPPLRPLRTESLDVLSPIPRAEVMLASQGFKVSRIGVAVGDRSIGRALLGSGLAVCYSKCAFVSNPDQRLNGFANTFADSCPISRAGPSHEVLCYVANKSELSRRAFDLDLDDAAAELFGIPECCSQFYNKHWARVREQDGDLFAVHLKLYQDTSLRVAWQCNAAAMYIGGGFCWHFPCSLDCEATKDIIAARWVALCELDRSLATSLQNAQRRAFLWSSRKGYGFLPEGRLEDVAISEVIWTGAGATPGPGKALSMVGPEWKLVVPD